MKSFFIFIGGFVGGILATLLFFYVISLGIRSSNSKNEQQVQFIEVKGKNGIVIVHTGMSKDSVKILVGKPDAVNLDELANTHYEKWGYKLKNEYISDLEIDFEDGRLSGIQQN